MLAVVRIRGKVNVRGEIEDTLKMLRLNRVNHCVLVPETSGYIGMLRKASGWVTWGNIDEKTAIKLFQERGMLTGNRKLDDKNLKKATKYDNIDKFVKDLFKGKAKFKDYPELKSVFRLNPPRKGYKSIRLTYPKGDLGDRKEKMNELRERMV